WAGVGPLPDGRAGPGRAVPGARSPDEDYPAILPSPTRPHLDYFHDFYGDTAMFGGVHGIKCGLEFFGPDHVVFATDAPLGPIRPTIASIERLGLSEADRRKIFADNAAKLINMNL